MIMELLKELQEEDEGDWKVSSKSFSYRLENGRFIKTYHSKEIISHRKKEVVDDTEQEKAKEKILVKVERKEANEHLEKEKYRVKSKKYKIDNYLSHQEQSSNNDYEIVTHVVEHSLFLKVNKNN